MSTEADRERLRKKWIKYHKDRTRAHEEHEKLKDKMFDEWTLPPYSTWKRGRPPQRPEPPKLQTQPFPEELRDLTCGARTRAGHPCKQIVLYRSGRCKFHGGLSTGPTSPEGKKRSALNGRIPKKKRTP
jgi:hypothetical protein